MVDETGEEHTALRELYEELAFLLDKMNYKFTVATKRLLTGEQYKAYVELYITMMDNLPRFRHGQLKFQCVTTIIKISAELRKDRSVELPFSLEFARKAIAQGLKGTMTSSWHYSHTEYAFDSREDFVVAFRVIRNLQVGQSLLPTIADLGFLRRQLATQLGGFHEHLERFDFLYFIWAYEKVLGYSYYFGEYETLARLLTMPKVPYSSRYRLCIDEMNGKDISVFLEACRAHCAARPYDPELIEGLLDRGIAVLEK